VSATAIPKAVIWTLLLASGAATGAAQNTESEFWPELDAYVNLNSTTRLFFLASFNGDKETRSWEGTFGVHLDFALKPVFRRDLRTRGDVFSRRFLSFRGGFRYISSLTDVGQPYLEHRWVTELTSRYPLPGKLVLSDRSRGELRFISGQPFSTRYRNRMQLESDFSLGPLILTPYVNGEVFYDTRYDAWNQNRYAVGVQAPAGAHLVLETYYRRQNNTKSSPRHVNAFGLTVSLYF